MSILAAALVCACTLSGCARTAVSGSPEQTVRAYLSARATGDTAAAKSLLSAYASQHMGSSEESATGIDNLVVGAAQPLKLDAALPARWKSYAQVDTVVATYETPPPDKSSSSVKTTEPLIVVRESASSPWRIELDRASQ